MTGNFEAKHPRARDGKFTEKYRAESGLELSVEKPFTPPDTPDYCQRRKVFVGKVQYHYSRSPISDMTGYVAPDHNEILNGDWWLVEKTRYDSGGSTLTYQTSDGFVQEFYGKDDNLEEQNFLDKDFCPVQDAENWTEKKWHENGRLSKRAKNVNPESEEGLEFLKDDIAENGGKLTVAEYFNRQGQQNGENYYDLIDGEIFDVDVYYSPDGLSRHKTSRSFDGTNCAPENEPCYYVVDDDGALRTAHFKVKRGNKGVFHRTNGPAIVSRRAPEGYQERYFLEGVEYTKAKWEEKVGSA